MAFVTDENRKWWTLGAVTFSLFLTYLDTTVVNVALPAIRDDFDVAISDLEWVVSGYLLTYAVFLLSGGKLADYFGRRLIFTIGLGIFTISSLFCGLASDNDMLIVARTVQGVGSALMLPGSHSLIAANFPAHQRGLAFGIWTGFSGLGLALGPLVGGLITEGLDWRWIFYVNIPIGILGIIAALLIIRESKDPSEERRLDFPGLAAAGAALFLLTFGLIEANQRGWTSTLILLCFAGAAVSFALFLAFERFQRVPLVPLSMFRNPAFSGALFAALLGLLALLGVLFFVSLYLQNVLRYSAIEAGAIFTPMTVLFVALAPIAGKLTDRVGPRWPITAGMALLGASLLLFSRLDAESGFWDMLPALIIGGIGMGFSLAPTTMAVVSSVPQHMAGVGSGLLNSHRQIGGNFGIAIMGAIVAVQIGGLEALDPGHPRFRAAFLTGFQDALLVGGLIALAGALIAAVTIRKPRELESRKPAPAA
ncbi:MAG: MFS transporter [Gaiellaceae bacterium]